MKAPHLAVIADHRAESYRIAARSLTSRARTATGEHQEHLLQMVAFNRFAAQNMADIATKIRDAWTCGDLGAPRREVESEPVEEPVGVPEPQKVPVPA